MSTSANRVQLVALCAIVTAPMIGALAASTLPFSAVVPIIGILMVGWSAIIGLVYGTRPLIVGVTALLAVFAGFIGAHVAAVLIAIVALISLFIVDSRTLATRN
jgi:hypothetical protein